MFSIILSLKVKFPPCIQQIMPKAKEKTIIPEDEEEEVAPHGVINTEEAKTHVLTLKRALDEMEEVIKTGTVENIMKRTIDKIKIALVKLVSSMEEANEISVLKAIKDMHSTNAAR